MALFDYETPVCTCQYGARCDVVDHAENCAVLAPLIPEMQRLQKEARQQAARERRYFAEKGLKVAA
jgi:hypothetical protein